MGSARPQASRRRHAHTPCLRIDPDPQPVPEAADIAVLDTQVVLDWLVFRDHAASALASAIECRSLRWIVSPPMLSELEHVLDRGVGAAWSPDRAMIRNVCRRAAVAVDVAVDAAAVSALRCADPDDQMFIDLAVAAGAQWLFTRDKALLRLTSRARDRGVHILRPADWPLRPR